MLDRARQRAPDAEFVIADALTLQLDTHFDRALLALFLHEQESADRVRILERTRAHLTADGLLVVADLSMPRAGLGRALWRGVQRVIEPPSALEVAAGALETEIQTAGYELLRSEDLAQGRLRAYVARPVTVA
jgi:ubiquinone/menaquinone biosynthesis C-methylase UbiE